MAGIMGTRTKGGGDAPWSYSDDGLEPEVARLKVRMKVITPSNADLRKQMIVRIHSLEREQLKRFG
jgi:hypothetical protein